METGTLIRMTCLIAVLGAIGGVGCFTQTEDTSEAAVTTSRVGAGGDTSAVLKSTLLLETGCTAAKVGPKVLVTAARCVVGSSKLVSGATVKFRVAAAPASDAGATTQSFVVSDVKVHSSFGARCSGDACGVGKDASDAADIAVVLLDQDLETVPAVPIDLDTVGDADPLLVVSSGCSALDARDGAGPRTTKTIAVPASAAAHDRSAYTNATATKLAQSYVVTAGIGWQDKATKLCSSDLGGPVFRGGSAAIAGVTSTITTFDGTLVPVTIEHTRVDALSRFKIADWLTSFGAETIHSCSESAGGCVKRSYDGGMPADPSPAKDTNATGPDDDGGKTDADVLAPDAGAEYDASDRAAPRTEPVSQDPGPSADDYGSDEDYADAAVPSKKSKKQTGGCSAAPGEVPGGDVGLGLALGLGAVVVARRRRR